MKLIKRIDKMKQLNETMQNMRVVYFCAHTGWGKTTFIRQYFEQYKLKGCFLSAQDDDFVRNFKNAATSGEEHIVIDDVRLLGNKSDAFAEIMTQLPISSKLYILGRCALPAFLKPHYIIGQLKIYDTDFFALSAAEIQRLFSINGKDISLDTAKNIQELSTGWMFGAISALRRMSGNVLTQEIVNECCIDIFECFDETLFSAFDDNVQRFLLNIGHLESFTEEEAQIICGQRDIIRVIDLVLQTGSFLTHCPSDGVYRLHFMFQRFLEWKQRRTLPEKVLIKNYEHTALYFSLMNDLPNAMKYYTLANDKDKMLEILTANSELHAGNGFFRELQQYYLDIPDEDISQSPELISAVSVIHSLRCRPEESERYFDMLVHLEKSLPRSDRRKKTAQSKIMYLKIVLPHRGSIDFSALVTEFAKIIKKQELDIQLVSVTGNMPSLMNGGKDFCHWSKNDKILYNTIKAPLMLVLGQKVTGLAEIGLGESLYEKNKDSNFTDELLYLGSGLAAAQSCGNIQLVFAATALSARIFAAQGNHYHAVLLIEKLIEQTDKREIICANMRAFLVWLYMLSGNADMYNDWFENSAPDECADFYTIDRYEYMIKIKIYIIKGMYTEAQLLLSRLKKYFEDYGRTYLYMEAQLLEAIILYRTGREEWKAMLRKAVESCAEYKFVRIVSEYGAAILPLLEQIQPAESDEYFDALIENTRKQAILYPRYMKTAKKFDFNLTDPEKSVLKLICDGLTNREIAGIIGKTERTIKFHLGNIYKKLNVDGRIEAVNFCMENDVIKKFY